MSEMQCMDPVGHFVVKWDRKNADECQAARDIFDELVGERKFSAFRLKGFGGKGKRIDEFDSDAEKMILTPQLVGG